MDNWKWIKRKYPEYVKEIKEFLNDEQLIEFRRLKYRLGALSRDLIDIETYKKGQLLMFKRSNPVNSYNYPMHHGIIKCNDKKLTQSGYHSINIFDIDIIEIV